ncbi:MAG: phage major capsid protein, partial [Planctomycetia bacterium]
GLPTGENPLSNGSGAELLPLPLANQLMMERDKASKFRGLVNVFPMTAQVQRIPVLPTVTATSRLENASYTDNTPAADSALLTARDIGVLFSAGRNFMEDSAFNIVNQLTVVAGGAIGAEEDIQIATSTANAGDITQGLDAAAITDIAEATTGSIFYTDFVSLYYGLPEQYRREAVFFAASTTLADVARILDSTGRPILLNAVDAPRAISDFDPDAVGSIMGKPVYDVPVLDDVIYFGNPMWYALGQRSGIRVDTDTTVTTGLRQWVIDERIDGRVIPTSVVGTNNAWRKVVY